jgi:hypothetical protein
MNSTFSSIIFLALLSFLTVLCFWPAIYWRTRAKKRQDLLKEGAEIIRQLQFSEEQYLNHCRILSKVNDRLIKEKIELQMDIEALRRKTKNLEDILEAQKQLSELTHLNTPKSYKDWL